MAVHTRGERPQGDPACPRLHLGPRLPGPGDGARLLCELLRVWCSLQRLELTDTPLKLRKPTQNSPSSLGMFPLPSSSALGLVTIDP